MPSRFADFKAALIFGSRLPAPAPEPFPPLAQALRLFPLVGAVTAGIGALALVGLSGLGLAALPAAVVAVFVQVLLTGALHEDGLADYCDGVGGGHTLEAKLAIMKDSRTGTYGVLALVFAVLARVAALAALVSGTGAAAAALALVAAASLSRVLPVALLHRLAPARLEGRSVEAGRPTVAALREAMGWGLLVATIALVPLAGAETLIAALAAAAAAYGLMEWLVKRQLGGQTGDAAGASQQAGEIAILLVLSIILA